MDVGWVGRGTCLGEEGSQHGFHLPGDGRDLSGKSCSVMVSCGDGGEGDGSVWGAGVRSPMPFTQHFACSSWEGWRSRGMNLTPAGMW